MVDDFTNETKTQKLPPEFHNFHGALADDDTIIFLLTSFGEINHLKKYSQSHDIKNLCSHMIDGCINSNPHKLRTFS
jgi:hypothetical protein